MPDPDLPPSIYQGLGWSPAADPTQATPVPMPPDTPPDWGGLPPAIPQGMGWMLPPPAGGPGPDQSTALGQPPPTPTSLPSIQANAAAGQAPPGAGAPDYRVPVSAFKGPAGAQSPGSQQSPKPATPPTGTPAAPARPQSFDQQMAGLQQREAGTEQAQQQAIQAGVEAQRPLHEAQTAAFQQARQTVDANQQQRQAEDEQYQKLYATNEAKVAADRDQISSWKFNRNQYLDELGVGGKVRWGIGMVLAGIGQGMMRQGGPNPVMEMLQQNIHDANEAQYKQRDTLVQKLGFDRQTGQDAATYHATRQAEIDKADGLAYTALAKNLEEAAVKTADPIAQANGLKEAANVRAMGDEKIKGYIQMKTQHDQQQQQLGIEGGRLALEGKKFDWEKNKDQQKLDIEAAALLAKKQGKLSEEESKRALFIPGPDGKPVVARDQAGNPVLSAEAAKDRGALAATEAYNQLTNQMVRGIKDHGGESDFWHSADWQRMQTDYNAALVELHKAYGVESFRGEWTADMFKKIESAGMDPTAYNWVRENAIPALQRSNENVQSKANAMLHSNGYDGEPIRFANTSNPAPPTQSDEDKVAADALLNPRRGFDKRPGKLATELGNLSARGPLGRTETIDSRLEQAGGILPSVRQFMDTAASALNSRDLAIRRHYSDQLANIADNSESPETAAYAQQLLDRAAQNQLNAPGAANAPETTRGSAGSPRTP